MSSNDVLDRTVVLAEVDSEEELGDAVQTFKMFGINLGEQLFAQPVTDIEPGMALDDMDTPFRYVLTTTQGFFRKHRAIFEKIAPTTEHTGYVGSGEEKPALWDLLK